MNVSVTGVSATGAVGQVLVYERIVPSQSPSYANIVANQSPSWSGVVPNQSADWAQIAA